MAKEWPRFSHWPGLRILMTMRRSSNSFRKNGWKPSMRINGMWFVCDDGMVRPTILVEVEGDLGSWTAFPFLIDSGADRAVFCADLLDKLKSVSRKNNDDLRGVGGAASSVTVSLKIRMRQEIKCTDHNRKRFRCVHRSQCLGHERPRPRYHQFVRAHH